MHKRSDQKTTIADVLESLHKKYSTVIISIADGIILEKKIIRQINKVTAETFGSLPLPPVEFLKKHYIYDSLSGNILKHMKNGATKRIGERHHSGYIRLDIKTSEKRYRVAAHRVAWMMHYGEDPGTRFVIDHRDGNRSNNSIENLQLASGSTNSSYFHERKARSQLRPRA